MAGVAVTPISLTPSVLAAERWWTWVLSRTTCGCCASTPATRGDGGGQGRRLRPRCTAGGPRRTGRRSGRTGRRHRRRGAGVARRRASPRRCWPGCNAPGTDFAPALLADVQIAVSSVRQLDEVLDAVRRTGRTATVTVKVDTGLSRNGVAPRAVSGDADRAATGRRRRRDPAAGDHVAHGVRRPTRQRHQ